MRKISTTLFTLVTLLAVLIALTLISPPPASAWTTTQTNVLNATNDARVKAGCAKLTLNVYLNKAAQTHTDKMAAAKTLSHRLSGESSLGTRITRAGYTNWTMLAENIARGYTSSSSVVAAWMKSSGHRANILNCKYKHLGVGVKKDSNGVYYWTQDFGRK